MEVLCGVPPGRLVLVEFWLRGSHSWKPQGAFVRDILHF